jgi:hypothetical protein
MTSAPQFANYRPKEKVGENPPDNTSEDPSKIGDYTRTAEWKQARVKRGRVQYCTLGRFQIVSLLEMVEFRGYLFLEVHRMLDSVSQRAAQEADLSPERKEHSIKTFDTMIEMCADIGLRVTSISLIGMQSELQKPVMNWAEFQRLASEAAGRMRDEMLLTVLLHVPSDRVAYYKDVPQFGSDVASKFPKVVEDIQEAAKAFALGRCMATGVSFNASDGSCHTGARQSAWH